MRWLISLFISLYGICGVQAQNGFIQSYDLNYPGMTFNYVLLVEDTLVICGETLKEDSSQWGMLFIKMDTMGNVLSYKTIFESTGDHYIAQGGYKMIKTTDGGYAFVGMNFTDGYSPVIFKLDVGGNIEFIKEYPDPTTFTKRHTDIIEIENGYISIGRKQQMDDGLNDAFAMRIDRQGNKIWEINYGEYNLSDGFYGIRQLSENEILLTGGCGIKSPTVNPIEDAWGKAIAIKIDTLGNILWEWESEPVLIGTGSGAGFGRIYPTNDGNWVNEGFFNVIEEVLGEPTVLAKGEIVKRDTNFNVIWSTSFGHTSNTTNGFTDVIQTHDHGWVAVGTYTNITDYETYEGYRTGMIAKVNAEGDSLWSRIDTIFTPAWGSRPKLSSVVVLPSGSIIACGQVDRYTPEPTKSLGWIIKIDKDGCIEPGCNISNNTEIFPNIGEFEVFPNPTEDIIRVKGEGVFDIIVYEAGGKQLLKLKNANHETSLDLSSFPQGVYFLQIRKENQFLTKKIIKN